MIQHTLPPQQPFKYCPLRPICDHQPTPLSVLLISSNGLSNCRHSPFTIPFPQANPGGFIKACGSPCNTTTGVQCHVFCMTCSLVEISSGGQCVCGGEGGGGWDKPSGVAALLAVGVSVSVRGGGGVARSGETKRPKWTRNNDLHSYLDLLVMGSLMG